MKILLPLPPATALFLLACGGSPAATPEAPPPLLRLDDEPPGEACAFGGTMVHVGPDQNGDDSLSDDEITSTEVLCHGPTTYEAEVTIFTTADAEVLRGVNYLVGNLSFSPQAAGDLDAEAVMAHLSHLLEIRGDVSIRGPVADLALFPVTTIAGGLSLCELPGTDLRGLERIESVEQLVICENQQLTSLTGLDGLAQATSVSIRQNPLLASLEALGGLGTAGPVALSAIEISDNPVLTSLEGLHHIEGVASLDLSNNPIDSLAGLRGLQSIGDLLQILGTDLTSLEGLDSSHLQFFDTYAALTDNASLTSLDGFPAGAQLAALTVYGSPLLADVAPLADAVISALGILDAPALQQLPVLEGQLGSLHLEGTGLTTLAVEATFGVQVVSLVDNPSLTNISSLGIDSMRVLAVRGSPQLTSLPVFGAAAILSSLALENTGIEQLIGLEQILLLDELELRGNPLLTSLAGYPPSRISAARVVIEGSPLLTNVDPLAGLQYFGAVTLNDLALLDDISGMAYLVLLDTLTITNCPLLDECAAEDLRSRTLTECSFAGLLECVGTCNVAACVPE